MKLLELLKSAGSRPTSANDCMNFAHLCLINNYGTDLEKKA